MTNAVTMPQTPSEWLLARYDRELRRAFGPKGDRRGIRRDRGSNFDRRMFDLLDDHPGTECDLTEVGGCPDLSGAASWPSASIGDALYDEVCFGLFADIA